MTVPTTDPPHPGPTPGERFDPLAGEHLEDPYPFYAQARRDQPVFFSPALNMWVVTRYQHARAIMANPAVFSSRRSVASIVEICPQAKEVLATGVPHEHTAIDSDPPGHARWRGVLGAGLSGSRMRRLESRIRDITQARIDAIAPRGRAEVLRDLGFPIPLRVIAWLCGIGDEHIEALQRGGQSTMELVSSVAGPGRQVELARDVVAHRRLIRAHVERKRAEPGDDITSALIAGGGDTPFSDTEVVAQLISVVVGGHETTAHLIGNALHLLLSEPSRWADVVADPSLIPAVVEETLRIDSPVRTFMRTAAVDTELAGNRIAAGDTVLVVFGSANHDDAQFADPELFDLGRRNATSHLAFGHGIHYCVGAPLARIEARVILESLATRLPALRLAPGQQLRHIPQLLFRGFESIEIEW